MSENKKKTLIFALIPAMLAAALICALAWGFAQRAKAEEYFEAAGEYMGATYAVYRRCANELADNVLDMKTELAKLRVAASQRQTVLALEDIVKSGAASVSIMSRLPRTHEATEELMRFLVRIGDYARSLSRRVLTGERLTGSDIASLESLYASCEELAAELGSAVESGELSLDVLPPSGYYADGEDETQLFPGGDSAETVPEYPTLIYDGPFSESTEKAEPKGLSGEEVTAQAALETVRRLTGEAFEFQSLSPGNIPVYLFGSESGAGAAVTVTGGRILWFMRGTEGSDDTGDGGESEASVLPDDSEYRSLVSSAEAFLDACGYTGMAPSYSLYYNGMALFSFIWRQDGVRVYNDLVKVWLDRRSGEVLGVDANNYLFSHRERHMPAPVISEAVARSLASPRLEVDSAALALVPLTPSVEALCYELHGHCGEEEYAVYINALTGAEEQIFLILNDGSGKAAV